MSRAFVRVRPPYGSAPLSGGPDVRGHTLLRAPDRALYVGARYERRLDGGGSIPVASRMRTRTTTTSISRPLRRWNG